MSKRFAWAFALISIALPVLGMSLSPDTLLKDSDHKKLGGKIQEWIEAKVKKEGGPEAKADFKKELDKWAKKKPLGGAPPLSLTGDLGRALWFSYGYDKSARKAVKGKVKDVEDEYKGRPLTYTIRAPQRYKATNTYPLLIMIAEAGEKPFDYLTEDWVNGDLKDNTISVAVHMPEDVENWSLIRGEDNSPGGVASILTTFGAIQSKYAIDFDKVFLVGRMDGLQAAMATASQFPDRFAGVIGRTGDMKDIPVDNFRNLATFFSGGGEGVTAFKEAADAAGHENCTVNPAAKEDDIWSWIQVTQRVSNPSEVTILPGVPFPNSAYWLRMPPWDGEGTARLTGKINREENTITVEGTGASSVTISFNDTLLDLSKPVKVICNGVESVDMIPRSYETMLTYFYSARSDPGKLYVANKEYGLPELEGDDSEEDE